MGAAALSNKCSPMAGHPINLCFWGKNDGVALDSLPFRHWSTAYDYAGYEHKFHLSGISCCPYSLLPHWTLTVKASGAAGMAMQYLSSFWIKVA